MMHWNSWNDWAILIMLWVVLPAVGLGLWYALLKMIKD